MLHQPSPHGVATLSESCCAVCHPAGNTFENQPDERGMMQMVKVADVKPLDGEIIPDEEDTEN